MKRIILLIIALAALLAGCQSEHHIDRVMTLRKKLLAGNGCSFTTVVSADFGDKIFQFTMDCTADSDGKINFVITKPETIAGISGQISSEEGKLLFDEQVLSFDLLTDGLVTPVSAPWLLVRTLRGGYIDGGGKDNDLYLFQIDDSYEENPLRLDIWLNEDGIPVNADIIWDGRRVVSLTVDNFRIL